MNTLIWVALILFAYARPLDIYFKTSHTETVNGRVVKHKERDWVKIVCFWAAVALVIVGIVWN